MSKFRILTDALTYIEANLEEPIEQEEIARACYCSLSTLQKVFRYALGLGVKDYVDRRRLTQAARALLAESARVVDIALRYQYQSPEVFTRAFRRLWGTPPSAFRREWRFSGLFPKIDGIEQGGNGMTRKRLDITELYEALLARRETYVLCFDIVGLDPVNREIGHGAGDLLILESLRRIDREAADDMLLFRIGGDEFALATGLSDPAAVDAVEARVLSHNGEAVDWGGQAIPLSLRSGRVRIAADNLRYAELFGALHRSFRRGSES